MRVAFSYSVKLLSHEFILNLILVIFIIIWTFSQSLFSHLYIVQSYCKMIVIDVFINTKPTSDWWDDRFVYVCIYCRGKDCCLSRSFSWSHPYIINYCEISFRISSGSIFIFFLWSGIMSLQIIGHITSIHCSVSFAHCNLVLSHFGIRDGLRWAFLDVNHISISWFLLLCIFYFQGILHPDIWCIPWSVCMLLF